MPPVSRFQIDKDNKQFEVKELLLRPVQPYNGDDQVLHEGRARVRARAARTRRASASTSTTRSRPPRPSSCARAATSSAASTRSSSTSPTTTQTNDYRQTSSIALSKDKRFIDWSFPVIDERAGKVTYRAITTFKDGTSADSGEQPLTGTTLLLGEDTATLTVKHHPRSHRLGRGQARHVELHYVDAANSIDERESFTFRKGAPEAKWELALRDRTKKTLRVDGEVLHGRRDARRSSPRPGPSPTRT